MSTFRRLNPERLMEARALTPTERQAMHDGNIRFNTNVGLLVVVLPGIAACLVHGIGSKGPDWSHWAESVQR